MSVNTQWDSLVINTGDLAYNRINAELDDEPRLFRGQNSFITLGGKLTKRSGTLEIANTTLGKRCDRLWVYETLETPPKVYIIGSFYNSVNGKWELHYNRTSTGAGWQAVPSLRDSQLSTYPHELVVSRGLAYIKSFPSSGSSEKLGTIIFDGSGNATPVSKPWGLLGPTTPAAIVGATTRLSAAINASTTTIPVVSDTGFPATPFTIQVDFEEMSVTAGLPGVSWTATRGANGTTAAEHGDNAVVIYRNWSASDHQVDVNWYWRYTYAWETITGQVSNRAPVQTNIDKLPSSTGPFFDLVPKLTVQGRADTTNYPNIKIHRTTDGGGTYYLLDEIANTGAGSITYEDDQLETGTSGGTFNDPIPDDVINTAIQAPTLTSNSPPPTVLAPLETGTDTPQRSSPVVSYSGRLWYAIGNVLFFSGDEEIQDGIPEECWPSGFKGNFFRYQYPITNLQPTADALYVFTLQATYQLTGTNLETFSVRPIYENIGHPYGHSRAVTRWNDVVAFLTHDFRVGLITNQSVAIVSDPLYTDLVDHSNLFAAEFDFKYWGDIDKEMLVVNGHVASDPTLSRQWVFDLKKSKRPSNFEDFKPFWNPPWTIQSTAMLSARITENTAQRRLIFWIWNVDETEGCLVYLDPTWRTGTDWIPVTEEVGFDFNAETQQVQVPAGNHVNALRRGAITPSLEYFVYDRTLFAGDSDPFHYYYVDDFWTDPIPANVAPPWRKYSKGYKTIVLPIKTSGQHFAFKIQKIQSTDLFECQNITIVFGPDLGR